MLRIRLKRIGRRGEPHFRVVVMPRRSKRDGEAIEELGYYNPKTKEIRLKEERAKYWLSVGAKPTETAHFILAKKKVLKPLDREETPAKPPKKGVPEDEKDEKKEQKEKTKKDKKESKEEKKQKNQKDEKKDKKTKKDTEKKEKKEKEDKDKEKEKKSPKKESKKEKKNKDKETKDKKKSDKKDSKAKSKKQKKE